nr:carbohydrate sulfotransferase 1-like [Penaeus vannamei]
MGFERPSDKEKHGKVMDMERVELLEKLFVDVIFNHHGTKRGKTATEGSWRFHFRSCCRVPEERMLVHAWRRRPYQYFRRKPEGVRDWCLDADLRLLKTIRARASFVLPWVRARPDIKVVHLVRDPRGILNSVKRGGSLWSENNRNAALQCANIERDLRLQELGPHRYLRVRYEDLVESPLEETRRIFSFMGANFNDDVMAYLREHTWLAEKIPAEKQGYLKTFRDSNFKHDHWKTNMDNREIEFIENVCEAIMKKLNYHPLPPT